MINSIVITYFVAMYFQIHVHSHRQRVLKSMGSDRSYLENRLFGTNQVSILPGPDLVYENGLQKLFSFIINIGILNCIIFAIYYGYKTIWYNSIILFFGTMILSSCMFVVVQRWPLTRHLPTLIAFLTIPVANYLIWILA